MFKKTMTFDDLEGNEVTETFYFNYNKKEIAELLEFGRILEFPAEEGFVYEPLEEVLEKLSTPMDVSGLSNTENNRQAYMRFQSLILDAFGVKGADNVSFDKNVKLRNWFKNHVAFVELIFEFIGDTKLAGEFIEKCVPPKMVAAAKKDMSEKNSITEGSLMEMMQEAERRQQDPATRIEPGPEAAREALGPNPEAGQLLDLGIKSQEQTDGLSDDEILDKKPQELTHAQLLRAMQLKNR